MKTIVKGEGGTPCFLHFFWAVCVVCLKQCVVFFFVCYTINIYSFHSVHWDLQRALKQQIACCIATFEGFSKAPRNASNIKYLALQKLHSKLRGLVSIGEVLKRYLIKMNNMEREEKHSVHLLTLMFFWWLLDIFNCEQWPQYEGKIATWIFST